MKIIFLQNPWSPLYAGGEWPRPSWLRALARSRSGYKIRLLTDNYDIVYNASPIVAANPHDIMPPDEAHIAAILKSIAPSIVVACGLHAELALRKLWSGKLLVLPHPASRVLTNALYIQARGLLDEPGFFGRWALRQGRGFTQLEAIA